MRSVNAPSYPGLPDDFATKLGAYVHTPWVQTALLPDPRHADPLPADPEIVKWRLHPYDEPLFAGTCGGDASCTIGGLRPSLAARAGWAVCEVYEHGRQKKLTVGRQVAGTMPGPVQSAEGGELYALVFWPRHLDPSSPSTPRFVTDCERVYDGWHGRWNTLEPWTPHRDLWQAAAMLRQDVRDDVEVHWTPGHARPDSQHSRGPLGRLGWFANAAAHERACEAARWHPAGASAAALARTDDFAVHLSVAYARVIDWALAAPQRLPEPTPLETLFRLPRPPPLPAHTFAEDQQGVERCVRCLLPPALAAGRPCRPHGSLGHILYSLGRGVFCSRCGAYSFQRLELLAAACSGPPPKHGSTA